MTIFPPLEPDEDFRASWHVGQHFSIFRQPVLRVASNDDSWLAAVPSASPHSLPPIPIHPAPAQPVQQELFT